MRRSEHRIRRSRDGLAKQVGQGLLTCTSTALVPLHVGHVCFTTTLMSFAPWQLGQVAGTTLEISLAPLQFGQVALTMLVMVLTPLHAGQVSCVICRNVRDPLHSGQVFRMIFSTTVPALWGHDARPIPRHFGQGTLIPCCLIVLSPLHLLHVIFPSPLHNAQPLTSSSIAPAALQRPQFLVTTLSMAPAPWHAEHVLVFRTSIVPRAAHCGQLL